MELKFQFHQSIRNISQLTNQYHQNISSNVYNSPMHFLQTPQSQTSHSLTPYYQPYSTILDLSTTNSSFIFEPPNQPLFKSSSE